MELQPQISWRFECLMLSFFRSLLPISINGSSSNIATYVKTKHCSNRKSSHRHKALRNEHWFAHRTWARRIWMRSESQRCQPMGWISLTRRKQHDSVDQSFSLFLGAWMVTLSGKQQYLHARMIARKKFTVTSHLTVENLPLLPVVPWIEILLC